MRKGQEELQSGAGDTRGADGRLESWKEIAAFLGRGIRTVQRWEEVEGLPVHRHVHAKGGTVFALKSEIQEWHSRREISPSPDSDAPTLPAVLEEVTPAAAEATSVPALVERPHVSPGRTPWPRRTVVSACTLLVLTAFLAWIVFERSIPRLGTGSPFVVISQVGRISQTVISPTGDRVVYCWNGDREENNLDLYLRDIRTSTTRRLTSNENNDHSAAWAPDSTRIAFLRDNEGVFVIAPSGGEERRIEGAHPGATFAVGMSWSPDGRFLVYSQKATAAKPASIYLLDVAKRTRRVITEPIAGGPGDMYPAFSPDGRFIAFVRYYGALESDVFRIRTGYGTDRAPQLEKLTSEQRSIVGFDWAPAGDGVIYSSPRTGLRRLWFQPISGPAWFPWALHFSNPQPVLEAGDDTWQPSVARRSGGIAYSRRYWTSSIWRLGLDLPQRTQPLRRLVASTRAERDPAYSPDGSRIAFVSERSGNTEIWISDAEGHNEVQLTSFRNSKVDAPAWSPDGRLIAASVAGQGIYILPAGGGDARHVTPESLPCTNSAWAADANSLVCSLSTSSGDEVWRVPLHAGAAERITSGSRPVFGPDSTSLYFVRNGDLWRMTGDRQPKKLIAGPVGNYVVANDGVYFDHGSGDYTKASVKFYRFKTGATELISNFDLKKSGGLAVSPNARSLLVPLNERQVSELLLIR